MTEDELMEDVKRWKGVADARQARIAELEEALRLTRQALKEEIEHLTDSLEDCA